ncbi:MAG: hypothetical protein OEW19_10855 [Acidobacteriota bacterium]|nr:hypothetical protein [Acidobacteriota bacterium]
MDALLITVTVLSLAVALVMSAVAWRASRDAQQRAAARVAALSAAAFATPVDQPTGEESEMPTATRPWRTAAAESALHAFDPAPETAAVPVHAGFLGAEAPTRENGAHQRGLAVAAAVFAVLLGGFAFARVNGGNARERVASAATPLELLSLRHERDGAQLSVTGLVRNPASAPPVERISAVVLLFDPQGAFVTSATAPIDFVKLASGDESPFVVRMQAPASVARYRVSFRSENGTLTHVDRRDDDAAAAPVALTRQ